MKPPFLVSAPGKVIVYGEHAVVHGKAAIAAAISLRCYLLVSPMLATDSPRITLAFPDVSLNHSWALSDLPWTSIPRPATGKGVAEDITSLDQSIVNALEPLVSAVSSDAKDEIRGIHQAAAMAFLYLLLSLGSPSMSPCTYTMRSTIPIAAGLGSSASISVCIATALLHQAGRLSIQTHNGTAVLSKDVLKLINKWAFAGELCIHGNPSGVDNTVAAYGKAVHFKRTQTGRPPLINHLENFPALPLLLVDTKQARSTAKEVAKVGQRLKDQPESTAKILDAIDEISEKAHKLIEGSTFSASRTESIETLGELASRNHEFLAELGVSHQKLERIKQLVANAGAGWMKLTGGGGGGCAIVILKETDVGDGLHKLETELENEGFAKYETLLGAKGVGLLQLEGSDVDQLTSNTFAHAKKSDDVEALVGGESKAFSQRWVYPQI